MIYAARLNALQGEPGGGKTWVALHTCAEAINDGHHVIFIDLEDHPESTFGRMLALGCAKEVIAERFHYMRPHAPLELEFWDHLERCIRRDNIAIVVIDSIGELMALQGVRPNDDDAVANLYRAIPRRIADLGPAVILLDHVPKNNESSPLFAIGSQRKKAAIDGAAFMVETIKPFSAEHPGKIVLRTAKDRNGNFLTNTVAAEIEVSPERGGDRLVLEVKAPQASATGAAQRWTVLMGKVSDYLLTKDGRRANTSDIRKHAGIGKDNVTEALRQIVAEGWVAMESEGDGKPTWYYLKREFDEMAPLPSAANQEEF